MNVSTEVVCDGGMSQACLPPLSQWNILMEGATTNILENHQLSKGGHQLEERSVALQVLGSVT